jgi:hypothetical protein
VRAERNNTKGGKTSSWTFDLGVKGIILTDTCPKTFFLDASSFEKVSVLNELFRRLTPVRSTLRSVDGLGAVDTQKRPDFWCQILTLGRFSTAALVYFNVQSQGTLFGPLMPERPIEYCIIIVR